ncbi:hypothetical protein DCCM_4489 [Desulfocucumis palustris]|uniref:Uncharacterized protein n=2 Tax=Desulfocucumis palustris TaxID=1898651 RepID=A0A2L2XM21_9FIRM|nr:hypothetical protein DCCM_4489 [Desulfocucumis palustris]
MVLIVLGVLLVSGVAGCAKKESPKPESPAAPSKQAEQKEQQPEAKTVTVSELTAKEKEYVPRFVEIHKKISDLYAAFNKGSIDRQKLNSELMKLKPEVDQLNKESREYHKGNKLSPEDRKEQVYKDGLIYGKKLPNILGNMVVVPSKGVSLIKPADNSSSGNMTIEKKQLTDEELKADYQKREKDYQEYLSKLNSVMPK